MNSDDTDFENLLQPQRRLDFPMATPFTVL